MSVRGVGRRRRLEDHQRRRVGAGGRRRGLSAGAAIRAGRVVRTCAKKQSNVGTSRVLDYKHLASYITLLLHLYLPELYLEQILGYLIIFLQK